MMKFLSLSIALILFSSNAFGSKCVPLEIDNPDCKKIVLIDGKLEFVDSCDDNEDCIDGKYCCPTDTKPSRYAGYSGQISRTGNGLTCRCPDNKYRIPGHNTCYDCPETSVWGKTDYGSPFGSQYYDSENKEGCICEGFYDTATGKCIDTCDADVVKFSREGECCNPETGEGCMCTYEYLAVIWNLYRPSNDGESWTAETVADMYSDSYGEIIGSENGELVWLHGGACGYCTGESVCSELAVACCPCDGLVESCDDGYSGWGECGFCPKGEIGVPCNDAGEEKTGILQSEYFPAQKEVCRPCPSGYYWVAGNDDESSKAYYFNAKCVSCPTGMIADERCLDGEDCCRCPYYGQEYLDTEEVKGCFCPPGTYLNESEGTCSPCGNSDGSDSDEYTGGWNNQTSCSKCSGQQALAIRTGLTNSVLLEGNDDCVTCYYQYRAEKPHWNGNECVPCYEDGFSGGEVWSDEYDEDGSCISCFRKNHLYPHWNDESKQCEECPAGTPLWSTTAYYVDGQPQSGCVSCYEHHQDILMAYWNPYGFESSGGKCPINDEGSLDCCTYCDNQTYDVNERRCVNCYDTTACQECIAGGANPAACPCIHNDFDHPGTCMDCHTYCYNSSNGEIGVLGEGGICSCQNCPEDTVFDSGECIADP